MSPIVLSETCRLCSNVLTSSSFIGIAAVDDFGVEEEEEEHNVGVDVEEVVVVLVEEV